MISWGVAQHGLLFPNSPFSIQLLRDVLVAPYFQMYIQLFNEKAIQAPPYDMPGDGECTDDPDLYLNYTKMRCADKKTNWIVLLFLMVFVLLTNLLLFNLLIAIFSQTFEKIEGVLVLIFSPSALLLFGFLISGLRLFR